LDPDRADNGFFNSLEFSRKFVGLEFSDPERSPALGETRCGGLTPWHHAGGGIRLGPATALLGGSGRSLDATTANAPAQPAASRQSVLARHPLVSYFIMAYAFSWIAWSPLVLSEDGVGLLPYKLSPQASGLGTAATILLGPTLSAFIMSALTEGRTGVRRLLGRYVLWRVGLR
jgi:membrane protease YdiL (CAAX protease family)